MARVFAVTASTDRLRLDASGRGEVSFTISNTEKRLLRSRVKVQPLGAARADWFSLAGEADRDLAPDTTHQVTVRITAPATAAGTFTFQLRVVSIDNPDEDWTDGPATAFEAAGAPKPASGKFPWWILLVVGAVVLIAAGVVAYVLFRPPGPSDPCQEVTCAAGLVCGPEGTCVAQAGEPPKEPAEPRPGGQTPERVCHDLVLKRVPWHYGGTPKWSKNDVVALCKGTSNGPQPARCFELVMKDQIIRGGGTEGMWKNALDLCAGTSNADATIRCFQSRIREGKKWTSAISSCRTAGR